MTGAAPGDPRVLTRALGHQFQNSDLLREALTHPSVATEDRGAARFGYERLEFLGDRVLALVIAEWLLERFPDEAEGALARRHAALVCRETVAQAADRVGLGPHLLLSAGEEAIGGRANAALLGDACEAVIGALHVDGGLGAARSFIRRAWAEAVESDIRPPQDSKTALQEWVQARGLPLPAYEEVSRSGPDHAPVFTISVTVRGEPPAVAIGPSKRVAEREAAAALLERLAPP